EQIERTSHEVDQRADLCALGVLTYEMLSRRLPIRIGTNDSIIKVLEKKNKHKIPQGKIGSQVLENFCSILTHPDPEERPQNIEEVIDFIRKYKKSTTLKSSFKDWLAGYWESESEKKSKKVPGPDPKPVQNDLPPPAKERKSPYQWLLFWLPACLMFLYALSYSTPFLKKILGKLAPLLEQVRSFFHLLLFFFS
ncbi:hypothetical protein HOF92_13495, partial [bacterium]|nr:hypothetical protein [bacterium]